MYCVRATVVSRRVAMAAAKTTTSVCASGSEKQHSSNVAVKPVESSIRQKLESYFEPKHLEVLNESFMHKVPKGSETHFKVVIVSDRFANEPLLNRHRLVNKILEEELKSGVHALSIIAKTPEQWESSSKVIDKSPPCRGGTGL